MLHRLKESFGLCRTFFIPYFKPRVLDEPVPFVLLRYPPDMFRTSAPLLLAARSYRVAGTCPRRVDLVGVSDPLTVRSHCVSDPHSGVDTDVW